MEYKISAKTNVMVLSGESRIYKTERFIQSTARFKGVDLFVTKLAEGIILNRDKLLSGKSYRLESAGGLFTMFFVFGNALEKRKDIQKKDVIFYKYIDNDAIKTRNDSGLLNYMKGKLQIDFTLTTVKIADSEDNFEKLYKLTEEDNFKFPLLNAEQQEIVELEDKNVVVQGVAGSGKTNICIAKIVHSATRGYKGRLLYTTYSRGLLVDTNEKVNAFIKSLDKFLEARKEGKVIYADGDKKRAVENKLGVYLTVDSEVEIADSVAKIAEFLKNKVDYKLIEDLYRDKFNEDVSIADENYFIKKYVNGIKNHQLAMKLDRVKHLSYEVIYKEIYGLIFGRYDLSRRQEKMTLDEYKLERKDSFTVPECEIIYSLAEDYAKNKKQFKRIDNNDMSRALIDVSERAPIYSLAVIDEVQDMTEVNFSLMKVLARKMFCVGDALQMINPSYFSFAYLKRLLFEKDVVSVAELENNYRNSERIAELINKLGDINVLEFGTHSFVLKSSSVGSGVKTTSVYVKDKAFINAISEEKFDNFTFVVASQKKKEELRKLIKNQEILTVSEIKGLERETIVLYDVLSDNKEKWSALARTKVNRKKADENSVYRYYFNLFYVGVSRAKAHIYVVENSEIGAFKSFFEDNFDVMNAKRAIDALVGDVGRLDVDRDELLERIEQFIKLGQYDNARFNSGKLIDGDDKKDALERIEIHEVFISHGKYREAGIRYWEYGRTSDAKRMFELSGDKVLIDLIEACSDGDEQGLSADIIKYYPDVCNNEVARDMIISTVKRDLIQLKDAQKALNAKFKKAKEKKNG
ncbi:MAG: AAA family ATPase [Clostridia bacterium]|nr:AAA family ATPase [Clostridia bacterium]